MDEINVLNGTPNNVANGRKKSLNAIKSERRKAPTSQISKRPNYAKIHAQPLPVDVRPLPAFIPHNPLSLLRIAFALLSGILNPSSSSPDGPYTGYFSSETRSVHVTNPVSIRALWEKGFFGKGSLSRSEPNWLETERRRLGIFADASLAIEEVTNERRKARLEMKRERARLEAEEIQAQLRKEAATKPAVAEEPPNEPIQSAQEETTTWLPQEDRDCGQEEILTNGNHGPLEADNESEMVMNVSRPKSKSVAFNDAVKVTHESPQSHQQDNTLDLEHLSATKIRNQEHLQMSLEEAFFLSYGLGILRISSRDPDIETHDNRALLEIFRQHSYFPPAPPSSLRLDDPFLIRYVVYHHFRSLGWVVRDGIKFAVDYLLYERGPVFKHAEFAIVIIPSYTHNYWLEAEERKAEVEKKRANNSWHWLHCVNRVQAHALKTLVLVYVDIPSPATLDDAQDIGSVIRSYKIREFCMRRFSTNRNR